MSTGVVLPNGPDSLYLASSLSNTSSPDATSNIFKRTPTEAVLANHRPIVCCCGTGLVVVIVAQGMTFPRDGILLVLVW